jgi:predicted NACHT family NTPase
MPFSFLNIKAMKTINELENQLSSLYQLQNTQEKDLVENLEEVRQLFSPIQALTETVKQVLTAPTQDEQTKAQGYSHLWDALTNQMGIKSPVVKSALHLLAEQLLLAMDKAGAIEEKQKETTNEATAVYHSANHF